MQIKDIDFTQYKLAHYTWDSTSHSILSQDDVMMMTDGGKDRSDWRDIDSLCIALIPKDAKLSECWGDDRNDTPAEHNAWWFYRYPEGTILLKWILWQDLKIVDTF